MCCHRCENKPALCEEYWRKLNGTVGQAPIDVAESYASEAACCSPGLGAFTKGCTWRSAMS